MTNRVAKVSTHTLSIVTARGIEEEDAKWLIDDIRGMRDIIAARWNIGITGVVYVRPAGNNRPMMKKDSEA